MLYYILLCTLLCSYGFAFELEHDELISQARQLSASFHGQSSEVLACVDLNAVNDCSQTKTPDYTTSNQASRTQPSPKRLIRPHKIKRVARTSRIHENDVVRVLCPACRVFLESNFIASSHAGAVYQAYCQNCCTLYIGCITMRSEFDNQVVSIVL